MAGRVKEMFNGDLILWYSNQEGLLEGGGGGGGLHLHLAKIDHLTDIHICMHALVNLHICLVCSGRVAKLVANTTKVKSIRTQPYPSITGNIHLHSSLSVSNGANQSHIIGIIS